MALAALSAVTVFDVGARPADAAPSVGPFAGTYAWGPTPVTISSGGQIKGSSDYWDWKTAFSGRVADDGRFSFTEIVTYYDTPHPRRRIRTGTSTNEYAGSMAPDADGNLVLTLDGGGSILWVRQ